jgi:hypothetical protein
MVSFLLAPNILGHPSTHTEQEKTRKNLANAKGSVDQKRMMNLEYAQHLWQAKEIESVDNVSPRDVQALWRYVNVSLSVLVMAEGIT